MSAINDNPNERNSSSQRGRKLRELLPQFFATQSATKGQERRKCERIAFDEPVSYRTDDESAWESARAVDFSSSGIRLRDARNLATNAALQLQLVPPGGKELLVLSGKVRWSQIDARECGIQFCWTERKQQALPPAVTRSLGQLAERYRQKRTVRTAHCLEDMVRAYTLVQAEYAGNSSAQAAGQMHYDFRCVLPKSRTFLLEQTNDLVSTATVITDSRCGLPIEDVFTDEVGMLRCPGRRIAELTLIAIDQKTAQRHNPFLMDFARAAALNQLLDAIIAYARGSGITDLTVSVSPADQDVFSRWHFEVIGMLRADVHRHGSPSVAMVLRLPANSKEAITAPPPQAVGYQEENMQKHYTWTGPVVRRFLFHQTARPLWDSMNAQSRAFIQDCYPTMISMPYPDDQNA